MNEGNTTEQVHDVGAARRTMARRDVVRGATAVGLAATAAGRLSTVGNGQEGTPLSSPERSSGAGSGVTREPFGTVEGEDVELFTLTNASGVVVRITSYGGIVQSIEVPDASGGMGNVVLGFDDVDGYVAMSPYFGCIAGRYANRIAGGRFTLDGEEYQLAINNDPNHLHGGARGFDKYVWSADVATGGVPGLRLTRTSPDGEESYPGTLEVAVTYTLTEADELRIDYEATTDAPTILNLTNHSYFNLAGEGSGDVFQHQLQLSCPRFTPVDPTSIPTGELADVAGTPFDFLEPHPIGERIDDASSEQIAFGRGYDHNWVIDRGGAAEGELALCAVVTEPTSGRRMVVRTDQPGVQFYSGNLLDGSAVGTSGQAYRRGHGFCLETQHFPDSPNRPDFPSTELRPGETFRSTTVYAFSLA